MNDSYSAARIHAMRTKLIKPEEYSRLLRMSPMGECGVSVSLSVTPAAWQYCLPPA
jgi:vacuolar-type H+-ATPase subunit C/Vma6